RELGFGEIGISDTDLSAEEARLLSWLDKGRHGEMHYMARHGARRARPGELIPGTLRVISARLDYLPPSAAPADAVLAASRRSDATITRFCAPSCAGWPTGSESRSVPSTIAYSQTARPCWRSRSRPRRDWAGAASIRCCSRAKPARSSSWGRSTPIFRSLRPT